MIPVLSYIFLGGKCRYCKDKIRPRYIVLEILSGIAFLLFALSLKINLYNLEIFKLVYLVVGMLYLSILFIIGGIEKENHSISNSVLLFGLIIEAIYIIYLYILGLSIYKYVIYLCLAIVFILINTLILRKNKKQNYTIGILALCFYITVFAMEKVTIVSIISTLLVIIIQQLVISCKKNKNIISEMPIGFYLCFTSAIIVILKNFII